jgi:hypothetical protein
MFTYVTGRDERFTRKIKILQSLPLSIRFRFVTFVFYCFILAGQNEHVIRPDVGEQYIPGDLDTRKRTGIEIHFSIETTEYLP